MEKLDLLVKRFEDLERDLPVFIRQAVEENKEQIEDKQINQLEQGEYPDGEKITPGYHNDQYAELKYRMNPKAGLGTPDLKLTGDFYRGIKLNLESDSFTLDSTDSKTEDLVNKYGDMFGLSDQSKQEVIDDILKPELLDKVRHYLLEA